MEGKNGGYEGLRMGRVGTNGGAECGGLGDIGYFNILESGEWIFRCLSDNVEVCLGTRSCTRRMARSQQRSGPKGTETIERGGARRIDQNWLELLQVKLHAHTSVSIAMR